MDWAACLHRKPPKEIWNEWTQPNQSVRQSALKQNLSKRLKKTNVLISNYICKEVFFTCPLVQGPTTPLLYTPWRNFPQEHWIGVKHIMRYLNGTVSYGVRYTKESSKECVGYSDDDWSGDVDDRRSTSRYVFQISGGHISWRSKKQSSVALSTSEAEYMALAGTAQETLWLRQLTSELGSATTPQKQN